MLDKFLSRPIVLKIGDRTVSFASLGDYEFFLSGRTSVPSAKIAEMFKYSTKQLQIEARTIKDIEKRFVDTLSSSIIGNKDNISQSLKELDSAVFSNDHDWRKIIVALNEGGAKYDPFRRITLTKYMQYLSSRQDIIKYIYSEKKKSSKNKMSDKPTGDSFLKETLVLDNSLFENAGHSGDQDFQRLPKGEYVMVNLNDHSRVIIILSKHACELKQNGDVCFTDISGRKHVMKLGQNLIGRDPNNTVTIDVTCRDISRLHMIIENMGNMIVKLMDLSSHGTFLQMGVFQEDESKQPAEKLENTE